MNKVYLQKTKKIIKENYAGWIFVLPLVIGIAVFTLYPMIQSLIYSFYTYDGLMLFEYTGLRNFRIMFGVDFDETSKVLLNTFIYAGLSVPINLVLSYLVAVSVNQKIKGVTVFRLFYYLPVVIPGVVSGVIWAEMLNPTGYGFFNNILGALGLEPNPFFSSAATALPSVLLMNLWSLGGGMVLWLSALKNIPATLYEAASIDGAGPIRRLWNITVPLSTPMIFYNLVTGIIGAMQTNATLVFASNGGRGPEDSLYFIAVKIYNEAFVGNNFGYASALAWVLFFIIGLLTIITFKSSKWVYTGDA